MRLVKLEIGTGLLASLIIAGTTASAQAPELTLTRFDCATNLHATVIIQHDARDIDKLPAFPASEK
jgi:hypothetical protein